MELLRESPALADDNTVENVCFALEPQIFPEQETDTVDMDPGSGGRACSCR